MDECYWLANQLNFSPISPMFGCLSCSHSLAQSRVWLMDCCLKRWNISEIGCKLYGMSLYGPFIILKSQFKDHTVEIKKDHGNCFWFSLEIEMTHAHKTQVLRGYITYCDGRFGQWSVWPWKLCHYSRLPINKTLLP